MNLFASTHAIQRARERLGWNRRALLRMLSRVVCSGLAPEELKSSLRIQLAQLESPGDKYLLRLYAGGVFVFTIQPDGSAILVTVLPNKPGRSFAAAQRRFPRRNQTRRAASPSDYGEE